MTFRRYLIGFILSLLCTLAAFGAVAFDILGRLPVQVPIVAVILVLAVVQILVQLVCFLHVDFTKENRERLVVFGGAFGVVLILISGSLWIMLTLNGRMMPSSAQMEQYMSDQGGF